MSGHMRGAKSSCDLWPSQRIAKELEEELLAHRTGEKVHKTSISTLVNV